MTLLQGGSKDFLLELKSEIIALFPEDGGQAGVSAVEHCDLAPVLVTQLLKHLGPIGTASIGFGLQSSHPIFVVLRK